MVTERGSARHLQNGPPQSGPRRSGPLQNRVTPTGAIEAVPERGGMMGNRGGRMHDQAQRLGRRRWASRQWICCVLAFRDRQRRVMGPASYTELFFLDEATALAAGHRPCFECRRQDALAFAQAWRQARGETGRAGAGEMDRVLHAERWASGGPAAASAAAPLAPEEAPDGTFVCRAGVPHLVVRTRLLAWSHRGYAPPCDWPDGQRLWPITPTSIRRILALGYRPGVHASAHDWARS
jgi:hypothetical protein